MQNEEILKAAQTAIQARIDYEKAGEVYIAAHTKACEADHVYRETSRVYDAARTELLKLVGYVNPWDAK